MSTRSRGRPLRILVTGFGPFPGAPENPTGRLVRALVRNSRLGVTVKAHVFPTRYKAVDRALPRLLKTFKPDALVMFGLATRARALRVETLARNRISDRPDAGGFTPGPCQIDAASRRSLPVRAPVDAMLHGLKRTGLPARLSRDAGDYLCNYTLWLATRAAGQRDGMELSAFIHVPKLSLRITPEALLAAGEAVLDTTIAALRRKRRKPVGG
ncbi:MAG: pyroglutamyl-peptidase I [Pseudorhodoplanes sp.]|uniref:pyroglutamyl-peptidase I family protein n=1 Tax=Pseudorhodoplanes sp. TaxID=1934341 RepID=UPI003D104A24